MLDVGVDGSFAMDDDGDVWLPCCPDLSFFFVLRLADAPQDSMKRFVAVFMKLVEKASSMRASASSCLVKGPSFDACSSKQQSTRPMGASRTLWPSSICLTAHL